MVGGRGAGGAGGLKWKKGGTGMALFGRYTFSYVVTKVNGKKSRQLLAH